MKALIGERFLINLNQGIARGCGAGRDGVSVNVDGKSHLADIWNFQKKPCLWKNTGKIRKSSNN